MLKYTADFETTTDPNDVRVWASCIVNIDTFEVEHISNSIEGFFEFIKKKNSQVYFHNLKFDGEFIEHWLLTHGFKHSRDKEPNTFNTLITEEGVFYSLTIYFEKFNKRYHKCEIRDSLKKLPFPVSTIAKTFQLEESKGVIDYRAERPLGHELTEEEKEYIINDCMIVAKALNHQFYEGLSKMTIGGDALNSFKSTIGNKNFDSYFPVLPFEVDKDLRQAYKGGFTYLNPKFAGKRLKGIVFDVNSLYPSCMYDRDLPYGYPISFKGAYKPDRYHPLYIVRFSCQFVLKKNHIPTVQLKKNSAFVQTEYLTSSKGEIVDMTMTNVDLKLFLEHYNTYNLEYEGGYKFKSCNGIFKEYIDYWNGIKEKSTGGARQIAKLMLNNLYGKFGTNPKSAKKYPYLDSNNVVKYITEKEEIRDSVYIPMASFITAYAREKTIRTAQSVYERFIYADTDSLHLVGTEEPSNMDIHPTHLGCWKFEGEFIDSKFLRAKTYMETNPEGHTEVKCAGMPDNVKKNVNYDNFTIGASFSGKLQPKRYAGGIVLQDTDFTIKKGV